MRIESTKSGLQEYYSYLQVVQDENATSIAVLLPGSERIYDIDLESRTIEAPEEITIVLDDHNAETIFFRFPRYYDNFDLTSTVCVIQYINAKKEYCIYPVPYYDIDTFSVQDPELGIDEPMVLIPWRISGTAAAKAGTVTFSIRFFQLDSSLDNPKMLFNLNTLEQTFKVKEGLHIKDEELNIKDNGEGEPVLKDMLDDFLTNFAKKEFSGLTWTVLN